MPQYSQEYLCEFPIEQVCDLILDIESYPEFLPWCSSAQVIERKHNILVADLSISFKYLTESYRSEVVSSLDSNDEVLIEVKTISGPFKYLNNLWRLQSVGGGTLIKFHIDFCFKSIILHKIVGVFFHKACEKMLDAFVIRANQLYGK